MFTLAWLSRTRSTATPGEADSYISSVHSGEQCRLLSLALFSLHFFLPFAVGFSLEKVGIIPWHSCDSTTPRCYAPHLTGTFNWCQVSKMFRVRIPWGHSSLLPCLPSSMPKRMRTTLAHWNLLSSLMF